jgi:hypothetical protein
MALVSFSADDAKISLIRFAFAIALIICELSRCMHFAGAI